MPPLNTIILSFCYIIRLTFDLTVSSTTLPSPFLTVSLNLTHTSLPILYTCYPWLSLSHLDLLMAPFLIRTYLLTHLDFLRLAAVA